LIVDKAYIRLEGVRFHARHGVMTQERQTGGDFVVTLSVGYPFEAAMESDNVDDTLDYGALYQLVEREIRIPSNLLEHVAGRIAKAIEEEFPQVSSIDLMLTKLNPPIGADCEGASVRILFNS
jgi:dihydroneopterin aldolase